MRSRTWLLGTLTASWSPLASRGDVLEGGEPDGLGELVPQLLSDRRPHLLLVAHLHLLPPDQA